MVDYGMKITTEQKEAAGEFAFHCEANNMYSMIDHCMVISKMQNFVGQIEIVESVDNWSDHKLLCVVMNCDVEYKVELERRVKMSVNWDNLSKCLNYAKTSEKLSGVNETCCDKNNRPMCCDTNYCRLIDRYCNTIIDILNESTEWKEVKINNNKCENNLRRKKIIIFRKKQK